MLTTAGFTPPRRSASTALTSASCTVTSSPNYRTSSSTPTRPTISSASASTGCRPVSSRCCASLATDIANYDGAAELDYGLDLLLAGLDRRLIQERPVDGG